MVKHTQAIRQQFADELSVFDHFVGLALNRLNLKWSLKLFWILTYSESKLDSTFPN